MWISFNGSIVNTDKVYCIDVAHEKDMVEISFLGQPVDEDSSKTLPLIELWDVHKDISESVIELINQYLDVKKVA